MNVYAAAVMIVAIVYFGVAALVTAQATRSWRRLFILVVYTIAVPLIPTAMFLNLGWPVPYVRGIIGPPDGSPVLYTFVESNEAIYAIFKEGPPRLYVFPYRTGDADTIAEYWTELQGTENEGNGDGLILSEGGGQSQFVNKKKPPRVKPPEIQSPIYNPTPWNDH